MSSKDLTERLNQLWQEFVEAERKKKYPNIMLIGISGAGKSTLVNTIFGVDVAKVSHSKPETEGYTNLYDGHDFDRKINLIDTAGYELGQSETYLENVRNAINKEYNGLPVTVIWYCLSIENERIEPIDLRVIKALTEDENVRSKLCIVFTKCEEDDEEGSKENSFKGVLKANGLEQIKTFSVSSHKELPLDLDDLILWSANQMEDEDFRAAFIGSQMADLKIKAREAEKYINEVSLTVSAVKFGETLTADNAEDRLAEIHLKLITRIYSVYGVDCLEGIIKGVKPAKIIRVSDRLVRLLSTVLPKYRFVFQGIGIAAAGLITKAIGHVISKLCYSYVEKHIHGEKIDAESFFTEDDSSGIVTELFNVLTDSASNKLDRFVEKMVKKSIKTEE